MKILVGKPGLDGHSNGAEQIAVRARDAGMDVVYEGIRLTPARIAAAAVQEGVHVVGLSILSGSHARADPRPCCDELREAGADVPVVVGGIIPAGRRGEAARAAGVARVYTPKDFEVSRIMGDIVDLVAERAGVAARGAAAGLTPPSSDGGCAPAIAPPAPAALNVDRGPLGRGRARSGRAAARGLPGGLGGEAPAHLVGVTGPPGAGKSSLLSRARRGVARQRADRGRAGRRSLVQALGRLAARATARASSTTRATTAC